MGLGVRVGSGFGVRVGSRFVFGVRVRLELRRGGLGLHHTVVDAEQRISDSLHSKYGHSKYSHSKFSHSKYSHTSMAIVSRSASWTRCRLSRLSRQATKFTSQSDPTPCSFGYRYVLAYLLYRWRACSRSSLCPPGLSDASPRCSCRSSSRLGSGLGKGEGYG